MGCLAAVRTQPIGLEFLEIPERIHIEPTEVAEFLNMNSLPEFEEAYYAMIHRNSKGLSKYIQEFSGFDQEWLAEIAPLPRSSPQARTSARYR